MAIASFPHSTPLQSSLCSDVCSSERMLHHYYGLGKASWLTDDIYEGFDSDSCE